MQLRLAGQMSSSTLNGLEELERLPWLRSLTERSVLYCFHAGSFTQWVLTPTSISPARSQQFSTVHATPHSRKEGLTRHLEPGRDFSLGDTHIDHGLSLFDVMITELRLLNVLALNLGDGNAPSLAFLDPTALKLREGCQDTQHQRIQRRRPLTVHGDPLTDELDSCPLIGQLRDQIVEIPGVATEPIHRSDPSPHPGRSRVVDHLCQGLSFGTGLATDRVSKHPMALP